MLHLEQSSFMHQLSCQVMPVATSACYRLNGAVCGRSLLLVAHLLHPLMAQQTTPSDLALYSYNLVLGQWSHVCGAV